MGLNKIFKQKDMTDRESKDILEKNGVVMKDESNYHRKKFKFQEFGKFSEQQAKNKDNTLKPIIPNSNSSYDYDENDINKNSNHGYGFDPYAGDGDVNDVNNTITDGMSNINNGVQAFQLQEQRQETKQEFDPYGSYGNENQDTDLNTYDQVYDYDEFEEEELDEDEEEIRRIQRQTKDLREDTVNLSRTLVDNLGQANVTATNTLGVLGNQREKIYEMENNIGTMKVQQRFVDDHVKELEHYNRSLFHIKVNNPFTRNSRRRAKDQAFLAMRQEDRANKDKLNNDLYQSQRAIMDQLEIDSVKSELKDKYDHDRRVEDASKYLTKDHDEEDERMEAEIAANVEHAQKLAANLKNKAQLMNSEIQQQSEDLKQVGENIDHVDDKIVMTTRKIRSI
ncbi:hypothetical protein DAPK24_029590 [Pichia kluyveri]|uniref:t-SNARE coiled-coil homology domain-containing protein n=1 Tax=Pichia kluyveri TaxID=36015 RepID=A0AAV5R6V2_PICKL|nr:hypothetical protein DAPK24_029590 [Pichia kluyveri]